MGSDFRLTVLALGLALGSCARQDIAEFERTLTAQDSATAALGQWCAERRIADPPTIRAMPVVGRNTAIPVELVAPLQLRPGEQAGYRHVRLICGSTVLSEAHNWYVPSRLTPEMNATLSSSDQPFGRVAAPLHFTRERLESRRGRAEGCPQGTVLSHRALLRLPDGLPLALLVECYARANLISGRGN